MIAVLKVMKINSILDHKIDANHKIKVKKACIEIS
jgi:hypothetical protein